MVVSSGGDTDSLVARVQIDHHPGDDEEKYDYRRQQCAAQQHRHPTPLRFGRPRDAESLYEHLYQVLKNPLQWTSLSSKKTRMLFRYLGE